MINIKGLTKSYGSMRVLDGVDLDVQAGEIVLLLGANGAGKSTLFRCLMGITPYAGRIRVDGLDPLIDGRAVRARIGYMPQDDGLQADMSVNETLRFFGSLRDVGEDRQQQLLHEVRLEESAEARVDELSGGMRQRLALALALLSDPPILLMDEPTASLDGWSRDLLIGRVSELAAAGKAVLLSTHAEHQLLREKARSALLRNGRLVTDEVPA